MPRRRRIATSFEDLPPQVRQAMAFATVDIATADVLWLWNRERGDGRPEKQTVARILARIAVTEAGAADVPHQMAQATFVHFRPVTTRRKAYPRNVRGMPKEVPEYE